MRKIGSPTALVYLIAFSAVVTYLYDEALSRRSHFHFEVGVEWDETFQGFRPSPEQIEAARMLNLEDRLLKVTKEAWPECIDQSMPAPACKEFIDEEINRLFTEEDRLIRSKIVYKRTPEDDWYNSVSIIMDDNNQVLGNSGDGWVSYPFEWEGSGEPATEEQQAAIPPVTAEETVSGAEEGQAVETTLVSDPKQAFDPIVVQPLPSTLSPTVPAPDPTSNPPTVTPQTTTTTSTTTETTTTTTSETTITPEPIEQPIQVESGITGGLVTPGPTPPPTEPDRGDSFNFDQQPVQPEEDGPVLVEGGTTDNAIAGNETNPMNGGVVLNPGSNNPPGSGQELMEDAFDEPPYIEPAGKRVIGPWNCTGMTGYQCCLTIKHDVRDSDVNGRAIQCFLDYEATTCKKQWWLEAETSKKVLIYANQHDRVLDDPVVSGSWPACEEILFTNRDWNEAATLNADPPPPPTPPPTPPLPTLEPTQPPTNPPTEEPTPFPTLPPTNPPTYPPTQAPTPFPTLPPTNPPTYPPTLPPTNPPTYPPTQPPTELPTPPPTMPPSKIPTKAPTKAPTKIPTKAPTKVPTKAPTKFPTLPPTKAPTKIPTKAPTKIPTKVPTKAPTKFPTLPPTNPPTTPPPTKNPTNPPTNAPTHRVTTDGRCGAEFGFAVCPDGLCCSAWGYCGNAGPWCDFGCQSQCWVDSDVSGLAVQERCGEGFDNKVCHGTYCCSANGYCGSGEAWCEVDLGCQSQCWDSDGSGTVSDDVDLPPAILDECKGSANICLALDMSGSVCSPNYWSPKNCYNCNTNEGCQQGGHNKDICCPNFANIVTFSIDIINWVNHLQHGVNRRSISVVTFASEGQIVVPLGGNALEGLAGLDYSGGRTNHGAAIDKCQESFTNGNGQNFILLVTDGVPTIPYSGEAGRDHGEYRAQLAKQSGTIIESVFIDPGQASNTEKNYMNAMSSSGEHHDISDFENLNESVDDISFKIACSGDTDEVEAPVAAPGETTYCNCNTCTQTIYDTKYNSHSTCGDKIEYMMNDRGKSLEYACEKTSKKRQCRACECD